MSLYIIIKSFCYQMYTLYQMYYQQMFEIIGQFKICYGQL